MRVVIDGATSLDLGVTEATPTIGLTDYSRRTTDDFGATTVVKRGFSRSLSVRVGLPFDAVDTIQRQLSDLRAIPARWIADDRFDWLSVNGFYKSFDVDLATPALSFCTLTIEGLAETETVADTGIDPAPAGQSSTLQLVQPTAIVEAALIASNVSENDASAWSASSSYDLGAKVLRAHRVYESLVAANVGADPVSDVSKWLDTGPANRWAMFDEALGTATRATGSVSVTLRAGTVNAVALLDVIGASVRVQAGAYDRTTAVGNGAVTFLDMPASNADVTVTISGSGTVSIGTLVVGVLVKLGITESSPTAGIIDYSRKETDDFGEVTVVERAWSKRMTAQALIATTAIDVVANRIASVRARPSLWIGQAGIDSLTVYGFFKDFSIEVGESVSKLSLSIEGLSKAAKLGEPATGLTPEERAQLELLERRVNALSSDGILSAGPEKRRTIIDYQALNDDWAAKRALAMTYEANSPAIGSARVASDTAIYALGNYLNGLAPQWNDAAQDTPINAAAYRDAWTTAYRAVSNLSAQLNLALGPDIAAVSARVARVASDGWLTSGEKPAERIAFQALNDDWSAKRTIAMAYEGKSQAIGTARVAADNAIYALGGYLGGLVPSWIDTASDTPIDPAAYRNAWAAGYARVSELTAQLSLALGPDLAALLSRVDRVASDNWLTAGEKPAERIAFQALNDDWSALRTKSINGLEGKYPAIGAARVAADNAIYALSGYLNNLVPYWLDVTVDTPIAAADYRNTWGAAYQSVANLNAAITGQPGADGTDGTDGADGFSVSLSAYVMKVQLTAAGVAKSGELPQYVNVRVLRGAVDVTASCVFALTASASLGASISGNNVALTGASADGTIDIAASYAGITLQPQRVKVATIRDNAAPSSVGVSSGPNDATINSSSYTDGYSAKSVVLQPNANGVVRFYGSGSYYAAPKTNINTSITLAGKSQYRVVGNTAWLDGGPEVAGSQAAYRPADGPDPGGISITHVINGLTPLTNYEFRLIYRITQISNMEATGIQGGTMTAEQP